MQSDPAQKLGKAIQGLASGLVVCSLVLLQDCWANKQSSDSVSLPVNARSADVAASSYRSVRENQCQKHSAVKPWDMLMQSSSWSSW